MVCFSTNGVIDPNDVGWYVMGRAAFPSLEQPSINVTVKWAVIHTAPGCMMLEHSASYKTSCGRLLSARSGTGEMSLQLYCSSGPITSKLYISQMCFILNKQLNSVLPRLENVNCGVSLLELNFQVTLALPAFSAAQGAELRRGIFLKENLSSLSRAGAFTLVSVTGRYLKSS